MGVCADLLPAPRANSYDAMLPRPSASHASLCGCFHALHLEAYPLLACRGHFFFFAAITAERRSGLQEIRPVTSFGTCILLLKSLQKLSTTCMQAVEWYASRGRRGYAQNHSKNGDVISAACPSAGWNTEFRPRHDMPRHDSPRHAMSRRSIKSAAI